MMKFLSWLLVFSTIGVTATLPAADPSHKRPNIVIILGDDMGYSDLGCYGSEIATPNLDALAATGLRYTSFYNGTRCCPSRASLLTGLYPHQAGVADMAGNFPQRAPAFRGHLLPSDVTVAGALRPAGYRTMALGKWHVGTTPGPIEAGFEDFYGFPDGYGVDYFDPRMMVRLPADHPDSRHYEPGQFYSTDAITDHALDFLADALRTTPDQPWFMYLAYNAAHFPLQAPKEDIEKYAHVYAKGWDAVRAERLARLEKLGVLPADTLLSPRSPAMDAGSSKRDGLEDKPNPAWDSLEPARRGLRGDHRPPGPAGWAFPGRPQGARRTGRHAHLLPERQRRVRGVGRLRLRHQPEAGAARRTGHGHQRGHAGLGQRRPHRRGPGRDGRPGQLHCLWIGLGKRLQHPVPLVQALHP